MKSALVTLLLIVATAMQPILALPAPCKMPAAARNAVTCSGCCAVKSCCAVAERQHSSPLPAIGKAAAEFSAAITVQPMVVPMPSVREITFPNLARAFHHAHAPPPLALNCIQLI